MIFSKIPLRLDRLPRHTSVSLRHRDASAPTRRGLSFKRQLDLLTGEAKRFGREMGSQISFEFFQRRIGTSGKHLDNLIGMNCPLRRPIASCLGCFTKLAILTSYAQRTVGWIDSERRVSAETFRLFLAIRTLFVEAANNLVTINIQVKRNLFFG